MYAFAAGIGFEAYLGIDVFLSQAVQKQAQVVIGFEGPVKPVFAEEDLVWTTQTGLREPGRLDARHRRHRRRYHQALGQPVMPLIFLKQFFWNINVYYPCTWIFYMSEKSI